MNVPLVLFRYRESPENQIKRFSTFVSSSLDRCVHVGDNLGWGVGGVSTPKCPLDLLDTRLTLSDLFISPSYKHQSSSPLAYMPTCPLTALLHHSYDSGASGIKSGGRNNDTCVPDRNPEKDVWKVSSALHVCLVTLF